MSIIRFNMITIIHTYVSPSLLLVFTGVDLIVTDLPSLPKDAAHSPVKLMLSDKCCFQWREMTVSRYVL